MKQRTISLRWRKVTNWKKNSMTTEVILDRNHSGEDSLVQTGSWDDTQGLVICVWSCGLDD